MSTSSRERIARLEQFIVDQRLRLAAVEADADDPIEAALKDVEWLLRVAEVLPDLRERCQKADATLHARGRDNPRINGKAEGVRLALSYIEEELRGMQ